MMCWRLLLSVHSETRITCMQMFVDLDEANLDVC